MDLNRSQLSLIITFFSLSIVILLLFNIHLGSKEQEEYIIEISLADEELEKIIEELERQEQLANADPIKSHMAFNETAKSSFEEPEPLKTLEELLEEKEASMNEDEFQEYLNSDSGYAASLKDLVKKREEKKQQLEEVEAKKKEFTNNFEKRKTSISYSLVNRNNYELPPPIYTCIEGGKVVVNIEVDASGNVIDASFNSKSSNTSNGCLVENAISYALKAKFSSATRNSQKGTITYLFQSK
ncbi:energy transducer TonB [uncultured Eudoraea sp.]|uniref:energy transducer TonB family protein n=1 Tax=uncultured Eudoraea sp. TaxID=1035614 RepID=UPI0026221540|nr:energy transducer TonB [uncultured Eudoraea sp.]